MSDFLEPRIVKFWIAFVGATVVSVSTSFSTTLHWKQLGEPGCGGAVTSIAVSPADSQLVFVGGDMLGIGRSDDGGKTWSQADANAGLKGYEIAEFTFDPSHRDTIWVGTMDGPCKSEDQGKNWKVKRNGFPRDGQFSKFVAPVQKILIDPADARHLLAFGGNKRGFDDGKCENYGAVWESRTGGESWRLLGRIDESKSGHEANITSVAYAAGGKTPRLFASVPDYGVMRSDDGGKIWVACNAGLPGRAARHLVVHPKEPGTVWVAIDQKGVFKTVDSGEHWEGSRGGLPEEGTFDTLAVAASDPAVLYVNNYQKTETYRSVDGGSHWTGVLSNRPDPFGQSMATSYVTIDPHDARSVFVGTYVSIYHSGDGGGTWSDATALQVDSRENTWRGTGYSGLIGLNYAWNPFDPQMSVGQTMDDGKMMISRDDLRSWKVHPGGIPNYSGGADVCFAREKGKTILYAALGTQETWFTHDGIYKSVDTGQTWSLTARPGKNKGALSVYAYPANPANVLAVFADELLYRSADGGGSWSLVTLKNPNGKVEHRVFNVIGNASTTDPTKLYAAAAGGIYRSTDGGGTWSFMAGSPTSGFDWPYGSQRVKIDPTDLERLLVININGLNGVDGIYRFDGSRWGNKLAGSYSQVGNGIADAAIDPNHAERIVLICNQDPFQDVSISTGVWQTEDGGKNWVQQNDGLGMLRGKFIGFRQDGAELVCATNGGGFYVARLDRGR